MPVGTSFENSAMKTSFSLSSLQAASCTPEKGGGGTAVKQRQYNSLTKNRVKAASVRRSWGSTVSDHGEDFWTALQANYNYIMDNQLIDKCQEANNELRLETSIGTWTSKEFYTQFSELYSWLNRIQETIYSKEETILDKSLRTRFVSMVEEKSVSLKLFNEQASHVVQQQPQVLEEVGWRVTLLNSKWDTILSILGPSECSHCDQDTCIDIDHEIKCLRKWLNTMDAALQPLDFRTKYTKTEIDAKTLELKVLHRDIESHGKIVSSVVKLCERQTTADAQAPTLGTCNDTATVRRIVNGLEKRWHHLFIRSLEWQCYIESLAKRDSQRYITSSSSESDSDYYEGPVSKYPRLSETPLANRKVIVATEHGLEEKKDANSKPVILGSGMIKATTGSSNASNGRDTVGGRFTLREDTSTFTKSDKKAPNLATYYFKHEDTDSDMDRVDRASHKIITDETSSQPATATTTLEETSEEEWTYIRDTEQNKANTEDMHTDNAQKDHDITIKPKPVPEEKIKQLVQMVEELVSPDKRKIDQVNSLNRMTRVKRWLSLEKPDDSCDASGEDDEKESMTSDDLDESTATFKASYECNRSQTIASFSELHNAVTEGTQRVLMRQKRYTGNRPWSVSCISQLENNGGNNNITHEEVVNNFSISESHLHKMNFSAKNLDRYDSSTNSIGNNNNSTSSTVEEAAVIIEEKTSPTRRRRLKLKKKSLPMHSSPYSSNVNAKNGSLLIKSGSFSGYSNKNLYNERHTSSDPPAVNAFSQGQYETSTTSGADSDEDANKRLPSFKLGSKTHYLCVKRRDGSPGKSSLTAEEQLSSLSEQAAWDSYQEKYLSEAYSETHDSDAARNLLEFGEDYRNFIDSQSDWSTNPDFSPTFRRRTTLVCNRPVADSDSDAESLRQIFNNSKDQLLFTQNVYKQQLALGLNEYLNTNSIEEMISTCDRHIDLLNQVDRSSQDFAMSKADRGAAADLLLRWQQLRRCVLKMQEYRDLQKEILLIKSNLVTIKVPEWDGTIDSGSVNDLGKEVEGCEKMLEYLNDTKKKLLGLNVSVHRFVVENTDYNASSLKSDVSDLYRVWDDVYSNTSDRLTQLRPLLQGWETLENRLDQLQGDLRSDEKTLHLLDRALKGGGTLTDQTATYVRDVAKLLSETTVCPNNTGCGIPELFKTTEGSLSDSGISDEGSEHELGERERRLAAIRRLVRQFEVVLAPDSAARVRMAEKLNAAEEELRELQKRCRSLIVRTAANTPGATKESCEMALTTLTGGITTSTDADPEDPDDDDCGAAAPSWFKRVFRASVPFQAVMITLLCLACLLEPQCCDNMNNFAMSFSPQLRYIKGPPPI